ncbi:pentatricopeptide repeat-containing protein [Corchorus olitorius]|uniref:Pentatricopeptide repeat-containing protein n=1 Tax=Corchorus olitorius TaxID=93759 RepID=A0A1R3K1J6_9ROSI|nr:pentatricopeptide repeat-containing protein [Corchorus olitorius]
MEEVRSQDLEEAANPNKSMIGDIMNGSLVEPGEIALQSTDLSEEHQVESHQAMETKCLSVLKLLGCHIQNLSLCFLALGGKGMIMGHQIFFKNWNLVYNKTIIKFCSKRKFYGFKNLDSIGFKWEKGIQNFSTSVQWYVGIEIL